jgi:hypothetical protein
MSPSRTLAESVLKELSLGEMSVEEKERALSLLETRFEDVAINTILTSLTEEEFAMFKEATRSKESENAVAEFIALRPELSQKISERLVAEREVMKAALN